jgi:hypothetical protein
VGGLVGLEVHNDDAVAHDTASSEASLTVPGISQRPMTSSWGCDRPAKVVRGNPSPALLQWAGHRTVVAVQAHEAPVQVEDAKGTMGHI